MPTAHQDPKSIEAIARRLIASRLAFGLSQLEFANRAGIPGNTYNQYEKAKSRPQLDYAFRLRETYGLTLDWLYFGSPSGLEYDTARKIFARLESGELGDDAHKKPPRLPSLNLVRKD